MDFDFDAHETPKEWTVESLNNRLKSLAVGEVLRIEGLPNDVYHASEGISTSKIKKFIECPYLYYAHFVAKSVELKEQSYFAFGDAGHTIILEPEKLESRYVRQPDYISTRNGAKWDIFKGKADAQNKTVLTADQWDKLPNLKKAIDDNKYAKPFLCGGVAEVSYYVRDEETGFIIKCRTDYEKSTESGLVLVDLKTAQTVDPRFMDANFKKLGYHIQDAVYSYITGAVAFVFVAIDSAPPHLVTAPVIIPETLKRLGYLKFRKALKDIKQCHDLGVWPMFVDGAHVVKANKSDLDELEKLENEINKK